MKINQFISFLAVAAISSLGLGAAEGDKGFGLKLVAEGFVSPSNLVPVPGSDNLLVADQAGTITVLGKDGKKSEKLFLDVRPRLAELKQGFDERGLLGLALHPKFSENKKFYVAYSAPLRAGGPENWDHTMRLAQFTASADGLSAAPDSEKVILEIDKPYFNHNGGCIQFGPDGYLYFSIGDGGNGNDQDEKGKSKGRPPEGNGQNLQTLLGKILRIDVNKGNPYAIPQDNPFVGKSARPEIWAYGLRNAWRISFDSGGSHELFAADVGQDLYEEVDIITKGGNYGWNIREGFHCFNPADTRKPPAECPDKGANGDPLLNPIFEYKSYRGFPKDPEAQGISITGGFVYRGKALPAWQGKYIFADWSRVWVKPEGVLFAATKAGDGKWSWDRINPAGQSAPLNFYITAFGQDAEGELYVLSNNSNGLTGNTGKVFKIVPM